jgi:predicted ATP-dependent endonuclease of OLD family
MIFTSLRVQNFQSIVDSGELKLGQINLLIGRNNTGKSALLRAVYMIQEGSSRSTDNIRLGPDAAQVSLAFDRLPSNMYGGHELGAVTRDSFKGGGVISLAYNRHNAFEINLIPADGSEGGEVTQWTSREPYNLIYPSLARRQPQHYQQQPTLESATTVYPQDSNLVSRVAAFATAQIPEAERFRTLCKEVIGFTVDVLLGHQQNQNQQLGIQVNRFESIPLEAMGAGVSSVLGLLVSLCDAKNKLFLIEEPENDLHPHALKALLDAIITASKDNQFIITTHNSIVLTRLGATPGTVVLETSRDNVRIPSSTYRVVSSSEERLEVLRQLGYGFADFYLGEGWLIFEESSAERIIRDWLIPWFVPKLGRLKTVAASGTSRVSALVQALAEMLIFSHLEQMYKYRAWVLVDGDESGKQVVEKLRAKYASWPGENFSSWSKEEFESYYPERFQGQVATIKLTSDAARRRELKNNLLQEVIDWIIQEPQAARQEFEKSAADVIERLTKISECIGAS